MAEPTTTIEPATTLNPRRPLSPRPPSRCFRTPEPGEPIRNRSLVSSSKRIKRVRTYSSRRRSSISAENLGSSTCASERARHILEEGR